MSQASLLKNETATLSAALGACGECESLSFEWLPHPFWIGFIGCFVGYNFMNSAIQYFYYILWKNSWRQWKSQTDTNAHDVNSNAGYFQPLWGKIEEILFGVKARRTNPPHFVVFTTLNIIIASCFSGLTAQLIVHPNPLVGLEFNASPSVTRIVCEFLGLYLYQSTVEYFWHRLMHVPLFYSTFHKTHHYFKSPAPFDDLYVNPLEVTGYYIILYAPIFFPCHLFSFIAYMAYHGFTGCMDHSGVRMTIPFMYNSAEHDLHHQHVNVNYGFPSLLMDRIFSTHMLPEERKLKDR